MKPKPAVQETDLATDEPECLVVIETGDPEWDKARRLWGASVASTRKSIEDKEEFGRELLRIKTRKGFCGRGGDRRSNPPLAGLIGGRKTWAQLCRDELEISDDTADRHIEFFLVLQDLRKSELPERYLAAIDQSETLEREKLAVIQQVFDKRLSGNKRKRVMAMMGLALPSKPTGGGDTSKHRPAAVAEITKEGADVFLSAAVAGLKDLSKGVERVRFHNELDAVLYVLPGASLLDFKAALERLTEQIKNDMGEILAKIDKAIAAKRVSDSFPLKPAKRTRKPDQTKP